MSGDDVTNNHRLLDSRPLSDGDRPLPYLVDTEPDKRHDESNAFPVAASLGLRRVLRKVGVAKEAMWGRVGLSRRSCVRSNRYKSRKIRMGVARACCGRGTAHLLDLSSFAHLDGSDAAAAR